MENPIGLKKVKIKKIGMKLKFSTQSKVGHNIGPVLKAKKF